MPGIYGEGAMSGSLKPLLHPLSDVGASVEQVFKIGDESKVFLDLFFTNGPKTEPGTVDEVAFEPSNGDNNDSKAIGGRAAFAWLPRFEIGTSFYQGAYDNAGLYDYTAIGTDFNYHANYITVNGEYIKTTTQTVGADIKRNGWYLQASWQARQLQITSLNPVELVANHSNISKTEGGNRTTYGVNYWLSPNSVIKVALEDTSLDSGTSDTRFFTQLAFGF